MSTPLSMNRAAKRRFIRDLTKSVTRDLLSDVPRMPAEWDGIELRELIAQRFASCTHLSGRVYMNDHGSRNADRRRLREFKHEVVNRNL